MNHTDCCEDGWQDANVVKKIALKDVSKLPNAPQYHPRCKLSVYLYKTKFSDN
jgi:hypothetical protein